MTIKTAKIYMVTKSNEIIETHKEAAHIEALHSQKKVSQKISKENSLR